MESPIITLDSWTSNISKFKEKSEILRNALIVDLIAHQFRITWRDNVEISQ